MTESVRELVRGTGYPNMKVLQFAFDPADVGGASEYAPHNFNNNCFMYTGTHDNETIHGWFMGLSKAQKKTIRQYLSDFFTPDEQMWRKLLDVSMMSVAKTCIIPIQDWLGLGNHARMNTPGTVENNWTWRLQPGALTVKLGREVLEVTKRFGRANWDALNALEEKKKGPNAGKEESN